MDDTSLSGRGTKANADQQSKTSHKHAVQQSAHETSTISVPTGATEAGTEPSQTLKPKREDLDWRKAQTCLRNAWTCPTPLQHLGPTILMVSGPRKGAAGIVLPVIPAGHFELHSEIRSTH